MDLGMGNTMRIHTDKLDPLAIAECAVMAGVAVVKVEEHGSRSRRRAFEVALSGTGVRGGMYGNLDYPTATWDEWGMVIQQLYRIDPDAIVGPYRNAEHFAWATCNRYDDLPDATKHWRHSWRYEGLSIGGTYSVVNCKGCSAARRQLQPGHTWEELSAAF